MAERVLMKGAEAAAEGAIRAGCRFFFGYPITPQNEVASYMARRLPEVGGTYLQAESEVASINMVLGAAASGVRAMTSSSSPGISLMQEGISYMVGSELPAVVINFVRGGPGLGGIGPSQSDYFQATKGGGHGDYNLVVLAPSSIQELVDLMGDAFDIADRYRNPVLVLADGIIAQMMEAVEFKRDLDSVTPPAKPWAVTGAKGRQKNIINSLDLIPERLEKHNWKLQAKFQQAAKDEVRWEEYRLEEAELVLVCFGTVARIAKKSVDDARSRGQKVGLIRPISLWPFPQAPFEKVMPNAQRFLVVEMNAGQMLEDVRLAVLGRRPIEFRGRPGGTTFNPEQIDHMIVEMMGKEP
jgi:2-oxoglutarate ferredoxin oxidoreductase subunit alpha